MVFFGNRIGTLLLVILVVVLLELRIVVKHVRHRFQQIAVLHLFRPLLGQLPQTVPHAQDTSGDSTAGGAVTVVVGGKGNCELIICLVQDGAVQGNGKT